MWTCRISEHPGRPVLPGGDTAGARLPPEVVPLGHGERFALGIGPVANRIGEDVVHMMAYGGSIPGPVLHVHQGSEIVLDEVLLAPAERAIGGGVFDAPGDVPLQHRTPSGSTNSAASLSRELRPAPQLVSSTSCEPTPT